MISSKLRSALSAFKRLWLSLIEEEPPSGGGSAAGAGGLSVERAPLSLREPQTDWEAIAAERLSELQEYQRALGLPYWDETAVLNDLWVRASFGDDTAHDIIEARAARERSEELSEEQLAALAVPLQTHSPQA